MNTASLEGTPDPGRVQRLRKRVLAAPSESIGYLREAGHLPVLLQLP